MSRENSARAALNAATQHHQAGRFAEAERIYRDLLLLEPRNVGLLNAHGTTLAQLGRFEEAVATYRLALSHDERFADAHNNLGIALRSLGRAAEAEQSFRNALAHRRDFAEAHSNLAVILTDQGRPQEAELACRAALAIQPRYPAALSNLGDALRLLGRFDEAEQCYRQAITLAPGFAEAHTRLGMTVREQGRLDEALRCHRVALALAPGLPEAHNNLGMTLRALGRLDDAAESYRRALAADPGMLPARNNLGAVLTDDGRLDEAESHYRAVLERNPASAQTWSNVLWLLNFDPRRSAEEIYAEHRRFGERFDAERLPHHTNDPEPARRLRVGYCSADLRNHAVAHFIEPVLAAHDPASVEVFCYHYGPRSDTVTTRLRAHATHWRDVAALSDAAFCDLIRQDGIDVLVDLGGHTARNRLTAFGHKPAPVQVTWLGYFNTTGLTTMDYRITDPETSPPGTFDRLSSERIARLPDSQWCYRPTDGDPPVAPTPSVEAGVVTFGAFTNPTKLNTTVLELWSRLLARVPRSRLHVQLRTPSSIPDSYYARFAAAGIPRSRLGLVSSRTRAHYLAMHANVDIMLDTFPVTGGTTTCDALWMGVPVVSLAGRTASSRGGASLLRAVGLQELISETSEDYLSVAQKLVTDSDRLRDIRVGLRQRMRESPLMDAQRFTRNLEDAYRRMWRTWCEGR